MCACHLSKAIAENVYSVKCVQYVATEFLGCRAAIKTLYVCLQVLLTGAPLTAGLFTITGCQVTAMGVSWKQPWLPRSVFLGLSNGQQNGAKDQGGHAQVESPA